MSAKFDSSNCHDGFQAVVDFIQAQNFTAAMGLGEATLDALEFGIMTQSGASSTSESLCQSVYRVTCQGIVIEKCKQDKQDVFEQPGRFGDADLAIGFAVELIIVLLLVQFVLAAVWGLRCQHSAFCQSTTKNWFSDHTRRSFLCGFRGFLLRHVPQDVHDVAQEFVVRRAISFFHKQQLAIAVCMVYYFNLLVDSLADSSLYETRAALYDSPLFVFIYTMLYCMVCRTWPSLVTQRTLDVISIGASTLLTIYHLLASTDTFEWNYDYWVLIARLLQCAFLGNSRLSMVLQIPVTVSRVSRLGLDIDSGQTTGEVFCILFCLFLSLTLENSAYAEAKAATKLRGTQKTMERILAATMDASLTLEKVSDGVYCITHANEQASSLLRARGDIIGKDICSFAADPSELRHGIAGAAMTLTGPALLLFATLQTEDGLNIEVELFALADTDERIVLAIRCRQDAIGTSVDENPIEASRGSIDAHSDPYRPTKIYGQPSGNLLNILGRSTAETETLSPSDYASHRHYVLNDETAGTLDDASDGGVTFNSMRHSTTAGHVTKHFSESKVQAVSMALNVLGSLAIATNHASGTAEGLGEQPAVEGNDSL